MNVAHMPVNYSNCMTWARVIFRERGAVDMRMTNFVYYFSRYFFVCFFFFFVVFFLETTNSVCSS